MPEGITIIVEGWKIELMFTECSDAWKARLISSLTRILSGGLLPSIPTVGHGYPSGMVLFLANGSTWFLAEKLVGPAVRGYSLRERYVNQPVPVTTANWN